MGGQLIVIGTISYFANHPFVGFAPYVNLLGLLLQMLFLSTWIAGLELKSLKLMLQSFYFQLIIFSAAYTLLLPKPLENTAHSKW